MFASSSSPTGTPETQVEPALLHLFRIGRSSTSCCDRPFASLDKRDFLTYWPEMVTCGKPEPVPAPNYRVCGSCWPLLSTEPKPKSYFALHPEVCGRCGGLTYSGWSVERTTELNWDSEGKPLTGSPADGKSS